MLNIEPIQEGSGDSSPDNVRPISGRTGATVTRTGKNIWPQGLIQLGREFNRRTTDINFATPILPGSYKLSYVYNGTSTGGKGIQFFNGTTSVGSVNMQTGAVTISSPAARAYFYMAQADYDNNLTVIFDNIQLELDSTATDYEPYTGTTYPVSWETEAGTVYGGTLDVVSGKLTVNKAAIDLGTLNWSFQDESRNVFRTDGLVNNKSTTAGAICSKYKITSSTFNNMPDYTMRGTASNLQLWAIRDTTYSDVAAFKTSLSGVLLVYELATPQTYQLTPQQILALFGTNVVWSDAANSLEMQYTGYIDD